MKNQSERRVKIVSVKLVKGLSMLYKNRCVSSAEDSYQLLMEFLGEVGILCLCLAYNKEEITL